jgi:tripartite-type tricarboxylate transporter receptor subunit TctC
MDIPRRGLLRFVGAGLAASCHMPGARAQAYPSRPVRWVLGFPAGGSTDMVVRLVGNWLSERLGQPFVVENKPGAGTNLAVQAVVNSPPDGYTLLFVVSSNAINATSYQSLPFNFLRDIAPVAALADLPFVMVINPSLPAKNLTEFIAYAKANPGKINMGSFGAGTISHLAGELFKIKTGVTMQHVPYRGGAPMVTDIIGGNLQAGIDALPNSLPHIRSGSLRALAITGPARSSAVPEVPTVGEIVPGYEVSGWTGVGVPTGTSAEIVALLNREINTALRDPQLVARLADVGGRPILLSPEAFGKIWASDTEKWAEVVKFTGISIK